jgi:hypothetical protein
MAPRPLSGLAAERDADAALWAARLHGVPPTLFKNVPVGARFTFRPDEAGRPHAILVRTANGYRHEIGGRQWRTGARVPCFLIEGEP